MTRGRERGTGAGGGRAVEGAVEGMKTQRRGRGILARDVWNRNLGLETEVSGAGGNKAQVHGK